MPRAEQSKAAQIVNFFRTSQIDVAAMVLGLCQDAVRERKQKSADAKARATTGATAAAADAGGKKAGKKRAARKRKAPVGPTIAPGEPLTEGEAAALQG